MADGLRLSVQQYAADPNSNSHADSNAIAIAKSCAFTKPNPRSGLRCIPVDLVLCCGQKSGA